jgi:hypothetical protein
VGMLQVHVDELHQTDDFPDNNMSKNSFWPIRADLEVSARPSEAYHRIFALTPLYFERLADSVSQSAICLYRVILPIFKVYSLIKS